MDFRSVLTTCPRAGIPILAAVSAAAKLLGELKKAFTLTPLAAGLTPEVPR